MKTPDETKKGLDLCARGKCGEKNAVCAYECGNFMCIGRLQGDALALIQQLEAERDAAVKDMHRSCFICKNFGRSECLNTVCNKCVGWCNWEWRGAQKEE